MSGPAIFHLLRRERLLNTFTGLSEADQVQVITMAEACAQARQAARTYTGRGNRKARAEAKAAPDIAIARRWMRDMGKLARRLR